jgi:hypothetical protein
MIVPASATGPRKDDEKGEEPYPRLQGRAQEQLAFVNNLLVTLALAVLAFAAAASTSPTDLSRLGWRRWLLGTALLLLAISLVVGIALALNRLQSFRITARHARVRQLRDRLALGDFSPEQLRRFDLERLCDQATFLEKWSRWGKLTGRRERRQVQDPADRLRGKIRDELRYLPAGTRQERQSACSGEADNETLGKAVGQLRGRLRAWMQKADSLTWVLIRVQVLFFFLAAIVLLIVPMSYYYK